MPWSDLDDDQRAALEAERAAIESHISAYVRILRDADHPDDPPFVQEWIVAVEWTNVALERDNAGGRDVIARDGATLSAGLGLGVFLRDRYGA